MPQARVIIGTVIGAPGETVELAVRLDATGPVTSVSTFFDFPFDAPVVATVEGVPACTAAAEIDADELFFGYVPVGCDASQGDCSGVEAAILDTSSPIGDGTDIFACAVRIADDAAAGRRDVACVSASAMGPSDFDVDAACIDGSVEVVAAPTATPTQAPPTFTPTSPPIPTLTATNSPTRRSISDDDDGCQVAAPADPDGLAWLALLAALPWWRRRRSSGQRRSRAETRSR